MYAFGYGLSYTTFDVSKVNLSAGTLARGGKLDASVTVRNTGKREGETVVQLYLQDVAASIVRPVKELKGFRKIALKPGESRTVHFTIDEGLLKFYNAKLQYVAEPGDFNVQIGLDSQNVGQATFTLK